MDSYSASFRNVPPERQPYLGNLGGSVDTEIPEEEEAFNVIKLKERGDRAAVNGDYNSAIEAYSDALEIDGNNKGLLTSSVAEFDNDVISGATVDDLRGIIREQQDAILRLTMENTRLKRRYREALEAAKDDRERLKRLVMKDKETYGKHSGKISEHRGTSRHGKKSAFNTRFPAPSDDSETASKTSGISNLLKRMQNHINSMNEDFTEADSESSDSSENSLLLSEDSPRDEEIINKDDVINEESRKSSKFSSDDSESNDTLYGISEAVGFEEDNESPRQGTEETPSGSAVLEHSTSTDGFVDEPTFNGVLERDEPSLYESTNPFTEASATAVEGPTALDPNSSASESETFFLEEPSSYHPLTSPNCFETNIELEESADFKANKSNVDHFASNSDSIISRTPNSSVITDQFIELHPHESPGDTDKLSISDDSKLLRGARSNDCVTKSGNITVVSDTMVWLDPILPDCPLEVESVGVRDNDASIESSNSMPFSFNLNHLNLGVTSFESQESQESSNYNTVDASSTGLELIDVKCDDFDCESLFDAAAERLKRRLNQTTDSGPPDRYNVSPFMAEHGDGQSTDTRHTDSGFPFTTEYGVGRLENELRLNSLRQRLVHLERSGIYSPSTEIDSERSLSFATESGETTGSSAASDDSFGKFLRLTNTDPKLRDLTKI